MISRFRPILMETFLSKKDTPTYQAKYHLDDSLSLFAKNNGLKISFLENIMDLARVFKKIPTKDEAIVTFGPLSKLLDSTTVDTSMIDPYFFGQSNDFYNKKIEDMNFSEKRVNSSLLLDRNFKWLWKIEKSIIKRSTFIAVGYGHLIPENYGLIDILRAKGYKVDCIMKEFK